MTTRRRPERTTGVRRGGATIRGRVRLGVTLGAIALLGISLFTYDVFSRLRVGGPRYRSIESSNALLADVLPPPAYVIEPYLTAHELLLAAQRNDTAAVSALEGSLSSLHHAYDERLGVWRSQLPTGAARTALLEHADVAAVEFFDELDSTFVPAIDRGDLTAAQASLAGPITDAYAAHRAGIDGVVLAAGKDAAALEKASIREAVAKQRMLLGFGLTGAAMVVVFGTAVMNLVTRRIAVLRTVMAACHDGDLTARVPTDGADEITEIGRAFNDTMDQIAGGLRRIVDGCDELTVSSDRLASLSSGLVDSAAESGRSTSTAAATSVEVDASVHDLAAAAAQLDAAIGSVVGSAQEASGIASRAVSVASEADRVVTELKQHANEISTMADAITDIAAETDLLALNATIEAARAGDHGRGFAVVAAQVKELAKSTGQVTLDIRERAATIDGSVAAVSTSLASIRDVLSAVAQAQADIAAATTQQTTTTNAIRDTIDHVSASQAVLTAELGNAASVADRAAGGASGTNQAASQVAVTADRMRELVGAFSV